MTDSLRDTVAKHYDAAQEADEAPAPVEDVAPAPTAEPVEAAPVTAAERARDEETGQFVKGKKPAAASGTKANGEEAPTSAGRAKADAPAVPGTTPPPAAAPSAEPTPQIKAPASWKPAAQELYAGLPQVVRDEIARREKEAASGLQETAPLRKQIEEIGQAYAPHRERLSQYGLSPAAAVNNYGQLHYAAFDGHPQQLGTVLSQMALARNDIDRAAQSFAYAINSRPELMDRINAYLSNQPPPQAQPQQQPQGMTEAQMEAWFQRKVQAGAQQKAQQEESAFASKHPYYENVKPMVQAFMQSMGLDREAAYKLAFESHPDTKDLHRQQEAARAAREAAEATKSARHAAGSPRPSHAVQVPNGAGKRTLRDTVAAAWDLANSGRD